MITNRELSQLMQRHDEIAPLVVERAELLKAVAAIDHQLKAILEPMRRPRRAGLTAQLIKTLQERRVALSVGELADALGRPTSGSLYSSLSRAVAAGAIRRAGVGRYEAAS